MKSALPRLDTSAIDADAEALHTAVADLVRVYQFRDRDRICCHDISVTQCYALEALVEHGPCAWVRWPTGSTSTRARRAGSSERSCARGTSNSGVKPATAAPSR